MSTDLNNTMPPSRLYRYLDIRGQRAVVTGATSGIGLEIARRLGELGVNLVLIGRRHDRLENLKKEIVELYKSSLNGGSSANGNSSSATDPQIDLIPLDITAEKSVVESALKPFQDNTDILINNAGLALGVASADETTYEDLHQMFATNMLAAAHLTSFFGKSMKERSVSDAKNAGGHVVFISSVAGKDFYEGGSVYCATKYAMNG